MNDTELACHGTDSQWSEATGNCGGCGEDGCHPGRTCADVDSWWGPVCDTCPHRRAQGLIK